MADTYYMLRADGRHEQDAKWVCTVSHPNTPARLLTASRDRTAASWIIPSGSGASEAGADSMTQALAFVGHTHFVNFVLFASHVGCTGGPAVITGSHDKNVLLWNIETSALDAALVGHDDVVKCGTLLDDGATLVTGSWDNTCIVWDLNQGLLKRRVRAHSNNVTGIAAFGADEVLSTSGDRTIARWSASTGVVAGVYKAHEDTVQTAVSLRGSRVFAAAFGADDLFASAGNDGSVFVWSAAAPQTQPIARFIGHESIVYHLACHPATGQLLSSGDDNTLRVWSPAACVQCIFHPDLVWSSAGFEDSEDIATACSDGLIRVWTRSVDNMAGLEKIELLENTVAATRLAAKLALAGVDRSAIPAASEATSRPGEFEGQRTLGQDDGRIFAYAWGQGRWDRIGMVVVDSTDDGSAATKKHRREKQYFNGEWYDYLLDVEIAGTPLKLPYNRGQSIFDAAQLFIYDNIDLGISQADKEQIQNHILNSIDEEDAALVGGAVGKASAAGGAGANYAFSAYAKELAELEAQGKAGKTGSYRDEFNRLLSAGTEVAFSKQAMEEAEAQAKLDAKKAGATPASSAARPGSSCFEAAAEAVRSDAGLFTGFTAAGATKKLEEFGVPSADAAATCGVIASLESSTTTADADAVATAVTTASMWLVPDAGLLTAGNRFPAIDAIRAVAATRTAALEHCVEFEAMCCAGLAASASDLERTVTLRLLCNVFGKSADGDATAQDLVGRLCGDTAFNRALAESWAKASQRSAGAAVKVAFHRTLSAMAAHLRRHAAVDLVLAKAVFSGVGLVLIVETDNAILRQMTRAAVAVIGEAHSATSPDLLQMRKVAFKELFTMVRSKKDFGDPEVMTACQHIYSILLPLSE